MFRGLPSLTPWARLTPRAVFVRSDISRNTGEKAPCPCIADGVMIATQASLGQGTLHVAAEKAPAGSYAVIVIRDRQSGNAIKYTVSDEWAPKIMEWNRTLDPAGRYEAAMAAQGLFQVAPESN
jgi:hypothetical protein